MSVKRLLSFVRARNGASVERKGLGATNPRVTVAALKRITNCSDDFIAREDMKKSPVVERVVLNFFLLLATSSFSGQGWTSTLSNLKLHQLENQFFP